MGDIHCSKGDTHMKTTSQLFACGLAAVFIGAASPHAAAEPRMILGANGMSYSVKVQYDAADLATEAGLDKIYQRIKGAARRVCTQASDPSDPKQTRHYWQCVDQAVTNAVNDVNSQSLTALHQREADKRRRVG
jgi:UrcA family protein